MSGWLGKIVDVYKRDLQEFTDTLNQDAREFVEQTKDLMANSDESDAESEGEKRPSSMSRLEYKLLNLEKHRTIFVEDPNPQIIHQVLGVSEQSSSSSEGHILGFTTFLESFDIEQYTDRIAVLLKADSTGMHSHVQRHHSALVPTHVSYTRFWARYWYYVKLIEDAESRVQRILSLQEQVNGSDSDDDLQWDNDSDDESTPSPSKPVSPRPESNASDQKVKEQAAEIAGLLKTVEEKDNRISALELTLAKTKSENAALRDRIDNNDVLVSQLNATVAKLESDNAEHRSNLIEVQNECDAWKDQVHELSKKLDALKNGSGSESSTQSYELVRGPTEVVSLDSIEGSEEEDKPQTPDDAEDASFPAERMESDIQVTEDELCATAHAAAPADKNLVAKEDQPVVEEESVGKEKNVKEETLEGGYETNEVAVEPVAEEPQNGHDDAESDDDYGDWE